MKFTRIKFFSAISILSLSVASFGTSGYAKSHSTITNMEQLPFDLIEEVEVMDYQVKDDEMISEGRDFTSTINLEQNEITYVDIENNTVSIVLDDTELEYVENNDGTIIYKNEEEGYTVENQLLDGGFRQMFTIESESSPKKFKIDVTLDEGSSLMEKDGLYFVENSEGEIIFNIGKAWAVDSEGNFVETSFTKEGNSLYQTINYTGSNYPLTADPLFCSDTIDNTATKWDSSYASGKGTLSVVTRTCAKVYLTTNWTLGPSVLSVVSQSSLMKDMWAEVKADASFKAHVKSSQEGRIKDQFVCHAVNPTTIYKSSWNLEPWRPDKSLALTYKDLCNPK
ncbi:DUF2599 domain-containing protein [Rossellomorea aquimaris]|uniref:DUF2599 domain-containing protein n=1 Tax=Rossellomorea aquimaris TaxID=189382 RepID=UPI001CFE697C|nr:DUF2599 domain-containing protein [Rossellomorea aquimaris]